MTYGVGFGWLQSLYPRWRHIGEEDAYALLRKTAMDQGRKLAEGPAAAVHQDARVLEAYLGLAPETSS